MSAHIVIILKALFFHALTAGHWLTFEEVGRVCKPPLPELKWNKADLTPIQVNYEKRIILKKRFLVDVVNFPKSNSK